MTTIYTHTISPIESACGVTIEQVSETMARALVTRDRIILPANTPPALGGSVARAILRGQATEFVGFNELGNPVWRAL